MYSYDVSHSLSMLTGWFHSEQPYEKLQHNHLQNFM